MHKEDTILLERLLKSVKRKFGFESVYALLKLLSEYVQSIPDWVYNTHDTELSLGDWSKFLDSLKDDGKPNKALRDAAKKYKKSLIRPNKEEIKKDKRRPLND